MRLNRWSSILLGAGVVLTGTSFLLPDTWGIETPSEASVAATRRETKMLDDLYKTAIVTVTDLYVQDETSTAAATAFRPVFKAMKDAKHHEARLVDGLGDPINPDNAPRDAFEKEAMKAMLAGQATYERIETVDGTAQLRTMTILPMVMEKCVLCHDNYKGKKTVGGVSYVVPIR